MSYLPVTRDVMLAELDVAIKILTKWHKEIEDGVPGIDKPGHAENVEEFLRVFYSELLVVSGKCENLSNVIAQQL